VDHRQAIVCAAFEDTAGTHHTQRNLDYVFSVGDEATRAHILAGCRNSDDALRPLFRGIFGTYDTEDNGLFVDFNACSSGWHYKW
jgi:hypothetical protein